VDQADGGTHPASFTQMVDDGDRMLLCDLRVEQGGAASLRELLAARPAAQEPDAVLAVDFAYGEIVLAWETKSLALGIHTRESSEVGSLHEVLPEHSWSLSPELHTTRRLLSIGVMITGHYQILQNPLNKQPIIEYFQCLQFTGALEGALCCTK
jgi:hypothetical protein